MRRFPRLSVLTAVIAAIAIAIPVTALAHGGGSRLSAEPWVFVGTSAQCGGPAGSRIVTSGWLRGMGLPDNGGQNAPNPSTRNDRHLGLLLNKNGPTTDCSSAGATIKGVKGITITDPTTFILGYDYRFGGHCGAGAPRFNLTVKTSTGDEWTYFLGCAATTTGPAPQDAEWSQTRGAVSTAFPQGPDPLQPPTVPAGSKVLALDIVFDEGTENPGVSDPSGIGLAVIDNIFVNGRFIRSGSGIEPDGGGRQDNDHDGHDDD